MAKEEITSKIKMLRNKLKQNYNTLKLIRCSRGRLKVKCIAATAYIKKKEKSQINNLILHSEKPEKDEQTKPTGSRK